MDSAAFLEQHAQDYSLTMKDGVQLHGLVIHPWGEATETNGHVLLHRTPYPYENLRIAAQVQEFSRRGYTVVLQHIRGRFKSGGVFTKYDEAGISDSFETLEAIAKEPFCQGKIGMWGLSYGAHTQAEAAISGSEHLGALILNHGGASNMWDHSVRHGGAYELGRQFTWIWKTTIEETQDEAIRKSLQEQDLFEWLHSYPIKRGQSPIALVEPSENDYFNELSGADYSEYWKVASRNWSLFYDQTADVPMMHVGGWYDIFNRGSVANYTELAKIKQQPQHLLIGPWIHGGNPQTFAGEVDFGQDSAIEDFYVDYHLRWFEKALLGNVDNQDEPDVHLFIMGGGSGKRNEQGRLDHGGYWIASHGWPNGGAEAQLYLRRGGTLSDEPDSASAAVSYDFDPRNPVPTLGGTVSNRLSDGAYNQVPNHDLPSIRTKSNLPLSTRPDVLAFQTDPFTEETVILGAIECVLYVSTDCLDTDFTAKVLDVYPVTEDLPQGFDLNLTDGISRLSYRNGATSIQEVVPGEIYQVTMELFPTANLFAQGHRLRVDISSSNFPRFDVNPNTGQSLETNQQMKTAHNTVYVGGEHASHIKFMRFDAETIKEMGITGCPR